MVENKDQFRYKISTRPTEVDGVSPWQWPIEDTGAFDGPLSDWNSSHREKISKHVKNRRTVFCAGGNCGLYTRLFADLFDVVYSFEPDPLNFYCLNLNCDLTNVYKFNCALGDQHKIVSLNNRDKNNVGMHSINQDVAGSIPMLKLDDFLPEYCDFIQLDVEGYETEIIAGGREMIQKFGPVIQAENGARPEIKTILEPLGYKIVDNSVSDTFWVRE